MLRVEETVEAFKGAHCTSEAIATRFTSSVSIHIISLDSLHQFEVVFRELCSIEKPANGKHLGRLRSCRITVSMIHRPSAAEKPNFFCSVQRSVGWVATACTACRQNTAGQQ